MNQIEADESMIRMDYNIDEGLVSYDFLAFLLNEIRNNLFNIDKGDFRHSSYLWWLIIHENLQFLVDGGLSIVPTTASIAPTSIDMRVLVLTKTHGSYYEFMEKCFALVMKILMGRNVHRLYQTIW